MKPPARDGARATRPLTLGVLVDRLHGDYQTAVIGGVMDAAGEAGQGGGRLQGGEPVAWPTLPR